MFGRLVIEQPKELLHLVAANDAKGEHFHNDPLDADDEEVFSMSYLQNVSTPKYKIGDRVWAQLTPEEIEKNFGELADDPLYIDGCISVVIVGLCQTLEGTHYHIGYWDEYTNEVSTVYDSYKECELFADHPGPAKAKPTFTVVK